jgi:hypothetical protein
MLTFFLISGETVSRASRDFQAEAMDAPTNTEGYDIHGMIIS